MERQTLVAKAEVCATLIYQLLGSAQETPSGQTIVDAHTNDGFSNFDRVLDHVRQVVSSINSRSLIEASAMDPERDRQCLVLVSSWANHIEVQAIFAHCVVPLIGAVTIALETCVSTIRSDARKSTYRAGVSCGLLVVCPALVQAHRVLEPEAANGSLRIWNAQEVVLVVPRGVYTHIRSVLHLRNGTRLVGRSNRCRMGSTDQETKG